MAGALRSPQMLGYGSGVGKYYKATGGLNPAALVVALLVGAVAAIAMAVPYAFAMRYIPYIKLRGICEFAFGAGMGVVPAAILKRMKVRNLAAGLVVCGGVGLIGLYAAWVVWEAVIFRGAFADNLKVIAASPAEVVRLAVLVDKNGTWDDISGTPLAALWAVEAAVLIGIPVALGRSMLKSVPFCDKCDAWCNSTGLVRSTTLTDAAELRRKLEGGDFAYVAGLGPPAGGTGLEFTRHSCGQCGEMNTLTVSSKTIVRNKKGKVLKNQTKVLVDKLLVSPADLQRMVPVVPAVGTSVGPAVGTAVGIAVPRPATA